jgi:hypothetical protein
MVALLHHGHVSEHLLVAAGVVVVALVVALGVYLWKKETS